MQVLRAGHEPGDHLAVRHRPRSASAWSASRPGAQRRYRRTLDADEIQYQVRGHRTLVTQRGVVELGPGDFVRIPLGLAHASVVSEPGEYVVLLSHRELPQVAETTRTAEQYTKDQLIAEVHS